MVNRHTQVSSEILSILLDSNAAKIQALSEDFELAPLVRTYISDKFGVMSLNELDNRQMRDLIGFIEGFRDLARKGE